MRPGARPNHVACARASLRVLVALALGACGASGGGGAREPARTSALEPIAFLLDVGSRRIEVLRPPERSIEELAAARGSARGAERRAILRDLARAHTIAARNAEGREARRHRDDADRFGAAAAEGSRDPTLAAEMDFLALFRLFESGARNAAARAERYTSRHETAGELLLVAWMIRGELALAAEDWQGARAAFRFALGSLGHPLYGYALYRTAFAWRGAGDDVEARQALEETAALGCTGDEPATLRVALLAASALDVGARADRGGTRRPASCPEGSGEREDEAGWRPPE